MLARVRRQRWLGVAVLGLVLVGAGQAAQAQAPAPPIPPTAAAHPGSAVYPYAAVDRSSFVLKDSFFGAGYVTTVRVPRGAVGPLPLVVFGHGKLLWWSPNFYGRLLDHLAKKGMVVASVEYEAFLAGAFSTNHTRFVWRFLRATEETLQRYPVADPSAVVYVGHSLGARVALLAAAEATTGDPGGRYADPIAIVTHAYTEGGRPPVLGSGGAAARIGRNVEVTIVEYEDDSIAGPQTRFAEDLYAQLTVDRKQWVRALSFASQPPLSADHQAILSGGPFFLPGGAPPRTDAIDHHFAWKITTAVALARSGRDPNAAPYAYGPLRIDGGVASDGTPVLHLVVDQSF